MIMKITRSRTGRIRANSTAAARRLGGDRVTIHRRHPSYSVRQAREDPGGDGLKNPEQSRAARREVVIAAVIASRHTVARIQPGRRPRIVVISGSGDIT